MHAQVLWLQCIHHLTNLKFDLRARQGRRWWITAKSLWKEVRCKKKMKPLQLLKKFDAIVLRLYMTQSSFFLIINFRLKTFLHFVLYAVSLKLTSLCNFGKMCSGKSAKLCWGGLVNKVIFGLTLKTNDRIVVTNFRYLNQVLT